MKSWRNIVCDEHHQPAPALYEFSNAIVKEVAEKMD
jgi:hypothetical protein